MRTVTKAGFAAALLILSYAALPAVAELKPRGGFLETEEAQEAFNCEACRTFCIEYEEAIKSKQADVHHQMAIDWARANTSMYRWDEGHMTLRPPGQDIGVECPTDIIEHLDEHITDHYGESVLLHALHAAAHMEMPAKMSWHFCRRVLCDQHLSHCKPDPDKRPYAELTRAYEHFLEHFDSQHHEPKHPNNRLDYEERLHSAKSHIYERFGHPDDGEYDPASLSDTDHELHAKMLREAHQRASGVVVDEDEDL